MNIPVISGLQRMLMRVFPILFPSRMKTVRRTSDYGGQYSVYAAGPTYEIDADGYLREVRPADYNEIDLPEKDA